MFNNLFNAYCGRLNEKMFEDCQSDGFFWDIPALVEKSEIAKLLTDEDERIPEDTFAVYKDEKGGEYRFYHNRIMLRIITNDELFGVEMYVIAGDEVSIYTDKKFRVYVGSIETMLSGYKTKDSHYEEGSWNRYVNKNFKELKGFLEGFQDKVKFDNFFKNAV